jgi:hypothetical protein
MVDEADAHRGGTCGDEQGAAEAEALYASPPRGEPGSSGVLTGLDGFDLAARHSPGGVATMATLGVHSGLVTFSEGSDEALGYAFSRTPANSGVRSLRLDKLGVTGSSLVPPIA